MALASAIVFEFADEVGDAIDRIHKKTFIETIQSASVPIQQGGNMPVRTGALRASVEAGGGSFGFGDTPGVENIAPNVNNAGFMEDLSAEWKASYGAYVEFGTTTTPARAFARTAVAQWTQRLAANVALEA